MNYAGKVTRNGIEQDCYLENFENSGNIFEKCEILVTALTLNNAEFKNCYVITQGASSSTGPLFVECNFDENTVISFSNPSIYLENCTGRLKRMLDNGKLSDLDASKY